MAKVLMIQGTMSNAGKSLIVAGLCRIFYRKGYKTAPFKAQNMALNSFITKDGFEMGRAQVVQAEACYQEPSVLMNPLLLKPVSDMGSQVVLQGKPIGTFKAKEFYKMKEKMIKPIMDSFNKLSEENDLIIIEGAGSPAEINLKQFDLVNMGMALRSNSPVLLVGDIDRGGVFAQLYGTVKLLEEKERNLIKGLIINKFRGDPKLLDSGLNQIRELTGIPVLGVVPYVHHDIDDEDSQSERLDYKEEKTLIKQFVDIVVIKLRFLSNYSDFTSIGAQPNVKIRYVDSPKDLGHPDLIIIPGTKSTISDLLYLKESGLEAVLIRRAEDTPIIGICGGYQILGETLYDPLGIEGEKGRKTIGLGLLPINTIFNSEKKTVQVSGITSNIEGTFSFLSNKKIQGYEIHMGCSEIESNQPHVLSTTNGERDGCYKNNVLGTYLHGFFDSSEILESVISWLYEKKGITKENNGNFDYWKYKQEQYDKLADAMEKSIDIDAIEKIIKEGV